LEEQKVSHQTVGIIVARKHYCIGAHFSVSDQNNISGAQKLKVATDNKRTTRGATMTMTKSKSDRKTIGTAHGSLFTLIDTTLN
jgi:hypothetical protein